MTTRYSLNRSAGLRSPACRRIFAAVPFGTSAPGFPATVTFPRLAGWAYCLWLPRCATRGQPIVFEHTNELAELHFDHGADALGWAMSEKARGKCNGMRSRST